MIKLMRWYLLCLMLIAGCSIASECAKVFIITFDAELYVPESESTIEAKAFDIAYIDPIYFEQLISKLSEERGSLGYDKNNTRAVVKYKDQVFYIDRFGVLRGGSSYGKIDSHDFEARLAKDCVSQ